MTTKAKAAAAKEAKAKLKAIKENPESVQGEQLNYNTIEFNEGDVKDFILMGVKTDVMDAQGDYYEAAILEDENGVQGINADVVLMSTIKTAGDDGKSLADKAEAGEYAGLRISCTGLKTPKSGNKPYKNLTILRLF